MAPEPVPGSRPPKAPPARTAQDVKVRKPATGAGALTSKPLGPDTWPAFARLVEKHHGIFGGCWCISFHLRPGEGKRTPEEYRAMKETRVREGRAHAALVFDGTLAVGWCQFGSVEELPNIRSGRAYEEGRRELPDWRITCFFIDRERRGEGIANEALRAALREIRRLGGGTVEAYPEDVAGRKVSRSFLCSGTLGMFEQQGFARDRRIAMHRWVVVRRLPRARAGATTGRPRRRHDRSEAKSTGAAPSATPPPPNPGAEARGAGRPGPPDHGRRSPPPGAHPSLAGQVHGRALRPRTPRALLFGLERAGPRPQSP